MLEALVSGTRDPEVLAELARGRLRKKIPSSQRALDGRFGAHHALIVGADPGQARLPGGGDRGALARSRPA